MVAPQGEPLFSEYAFVVGIDDEAAGEFATVEQQTDTPATIEIDLDEWPTLRAAINKMVKIARKGEV